MLRGILRFLAGKMVALPIRRQLAAFEAATRDVRRVQNELLLRIVRDQAQTDFGREHHFASIHSLADFRSHLPVAPYERFEPYLARVRRGELNALLSDPCVHMFALTSGTTASRKYIPVTPKYLADYRRGWNIWGLTVFRDHPEVKMRPIVQLSGDWDEFRTEAGIPCGSVTGLTATMQKRVIRLLYCIPPCVGRVKDAHVKYYLGLRLSIDRRVGMILAANPSTLVNMARVGDQMKESLIRDLHDGTLNAALDLAPDIRRQLAGLIRRRHKRRARELEQIAERTGRLYPRDYWPVGAILGNWTGGSVGAFMRHYPRYFGDTPVRDVGLIASEGRMTIPVVDHTSSGILDVTTHFFEFVPEEEIDRPQPIALAAHEVEEGRTYYIVPTTKFGLYRYHISDLVRVTGFHNQAPLVEFLSKGAHFANITGEKLSEYHVTQAMDSVLSELNLNLSAYSLATCWDDDQPFYGLFIEKDEVDRALGLRLVTCLDEKLQTINPEYASKRESRRLGEIRLELLAAGTWAEWDRKRLLRSGGAIDQYKRPCLIADTGFRDSMHVVDEVVCSA